MSDTKEEARRKRWNALISANRSAIDRAGIILDIQLRTYQEIEKRGLEGFVPFVDEEALLALEAREEAIRREAQVAALELMLSFSISYIGGREAVPLTVIKERIAQLTPKQDTPVAEEK